MTNIELIAEYISKGCKTPEKLGIETEHFIVRHDFSHISYNDGVKDILYRLSEFYPKKEYSGDDLIALYNDDASITIEPAGQIEISIKPCSDIKCIMNIYEKFLANINPILKSLGYEIVNLGYSPKTKAADMELIPKKRYEFMDKYFKTTGNHGINMMRATASTQISFDFKDEADCIKKIRYANVLTPILSLITDNSPIFDGEPYNGRMLRTVIWNDVDNARCGTIPCLFDSDFGFLRYAEYIYNSPAILIPDGNDMIYTGNTPICDIYKDRKLAESEIEHLLSMFFPDVRLKQYIELRPADSMKKEFIAAYAALIKALFINSEIPQTSDFTVSDIINAKNELVKNGYRGNIYGMPVKNIIQLIFEKAESALSSRDASLLVPLYEHTFELISK